MSVQTIIEPDKNSVFEQATQSLFTAIQSVSGPHVVLGLCGGRSIVGLLEAMAAQADQLPEADWRRLHFFMVDERVVPLEDDDSNYRLVHELFLSKAVAEGLIQESQLHPFRADPSLDDAGISVYEAELAKFGGKYDIVFLGVGEDAHVAGMFPNGVWVEQPEKSFVVFKDSPKPPPHRMTCTPKVLEQASLGVGMFLGEAKREAYQRFQSKSESLADCPVSILYKLPQALIISDLV